MILQGGSHDKNIIALFPPRPVSSQPSKPAEEPVPVPVPPEKSEASGAKKKTPWRRVIDRVFFLSLRKLPLTPCFGGGMTAGPQKHPNPKHTIHLGAEKC